MGEMNVVEEFIKEGVDVNLKDEIKLIFLLKDYLKLELIWM